MKELNPAFATQAISSVTVQVDSREKYPIPFPSTILINDTKVPSRTHRLVVKKEVLALPEGDYRLKEFPDVCIMERKASQQELYTNLFDNQDMYRQGRAFKRLSKACKYPYLMIEATPSEILRTKGGITKKQKNIDPELILHRIAVASCRFGFNYLWVPKASTLSSRMNIGRLMLHTMLAHAMYHTVSEGEGVVSDVDSTPPSVSEEV